MDWQERLISLFVYTSKHYDGYIWTYVHGVKVHILAFRRNGLLPLPDYIGVTPASEADINVLKNYE